MKELSDIEKTASDMLSAEEQIQYRNKLLARLRNGESISKEEKNWLRLNPVYNEKYGYPYLAMDVIEIKPNTRYLFSINTHKSNTTERMGAVFSLPLYSESLKSGYFEGKFHKSDVQHDENGLSKAKGIIVEEDGKKEDRAFIYRSKTGKMVVSYDCESEDHRGCPCWTSSISCPLLAMKKVCASDNSVTYYCTGLTNSSFDSFIFRIEWNIMSDERAV